MYRIRFHGRGGQGMKTASRLLGAAFFLEGYEVQDAPRYGAERRGAPIFAYVRASKAPINERGIIQHPDLVIVADDSLVPVPAAGVMAGLTDNTVVLISTTETADEWKHRLNLGCRVLTLPAPEEIEDRLELRYVGTECAGAAACLTGVISKQRLEQAIRDELEGKPEKVIERNIDMAMEGYDRMADHEGLIRESGMPSASEYTPPAWIDMPFEAARISSPSIHTGLTSVMVRTGLWRTMRPVIEYENCKHCWWVCSGSCPDGAISVNAGGAPEIDYDHCKGCLTCVSVCPSHAIVTIPEHKAAEQEKEEAS
ncbi:MAG: 2-oxoacid:acceptor oxidoreductase family protein [Gammaproteobacteria bacterium]